MRETEEQSGTSLQVPCEKSQYEPVDSTCSIKRQKQTDSDPKMSMKWELLFSQHSLCSHHDSFLK